MARVSSRWIGASLAGVVLLAGCGSAASGSGGGTTAPSTTGSSSQPSASANPPSNTLPTAPGSGKATPGTPTSSAGDITLKGSVSGDGLTCVSFVTDSGARYALGGPGLPSKLTDVAHSFGRRTSLKDQPSKGQTATVTLTGHVLKGAMSTCHLTTFSVTSAHIGSIGPR